MTETRVKPNFRTITVGGVCQTLILLGAQIAAVNTSSTNLCHQSPPARRQPPTSCVAVLAGWNVGCDASMTITMAN